MASACSSPGANDDAGTQAPVASSGCSAPAPVTVTELQQTISVDAVARSYLLTTPPTRRGAALPVVLDFHGLSESDTLEAITTQFSTEALANHFIVVFPQGTGSPAGWDIDPSTRAHPNHDIDFVNAMLNKLETSLCVDKSRVYATGLSDGALFSSLLACTMSNRLAAVAPVAGVVMPTPCRPTRPVPILAFHGTADPILHFNGGIGRKVLADDLKAHPHPLPKLPRARLNGPGYPAHIKAWAAKDGCGATPTDTKVARHVIHRAYPCPAGVAVEFDIIVGGGHSWPGSALSAEIASFVGPTTMEINATSAIWAFFSRFHLTQSAG